jgi:dihydrofolate synthase/folylpolyglutamate synthase
MRDKAIEEIAEILFPLAYELIFTAPDSARAIRPEALVEMAGRGRCAANLTSAIATVKAEASDEDVVVITGSLFLIGEARLAYSRCRQSWE